MTSISKESTAPRINVLGTRVAALNLDTAVQQICEWIDAEDSRRYVCVTDVHCIMQSYRRPDVRNIYNSADICVPDGMPLTWVGRRRGFPDMGRVYGPDLMLKMMEVGVEKGYSHYLYGGAEGVADELRDRMTERFPGLRVAGTYFPPFRPLTDEEKREVIEDINRSQADLFWVGLGAPKQDLLMAEFRDLVNSKVMLGVGAAFDFHTGRVRQAPRWMMQLGLEWFFRLCVEPRRLGPRYLRNNPSFLWHIFLQSTGLRRYPID